MPLTLEDGGAVGPFGVAISGNGRIYVSAVQARAFRGSLASRTFDPPLVVPFAAADIAFTPDEELVLVAHQNSYAGPITVIDPVSNTIANLIPTSFGLATIGRDVPGNRAFFAMFNTPSVYELRRVRDGGFVPEDGGYVPGFEGRVIPVGVGGVGTGFTGMSWDQARQQLYATHSTGIVVSVAFADGGLGVSALSGAAGGFRGAAYDGVRDRLYVANEAGALINVQLPSFAPVSGGSPIAANGSWGAALTPDNQELWLTNPSGGSLTIITLSTGATRSVAGLGRPRRIAFDATGQNAIIANELGEVLFFQ